MSKRSATSTPQPEAKRAARMRQVLAKAIAASLDSFGEEEAQQNKPLLIMSEVTGALMALSSVTTAMLATGSDAKTAVAAGLCVMPARMVYDCTVNETAPPPPDTQLS